MKVFKDKVCMVCTVGVLSEPEYKEMTPYIKRLIQRYENPVCIWCGNDKYFLFHKYCYSDDDCVENNKQFEQDLKLNPYYDPQKAEEARIKSNCAQASALYDIQKPYEKDKNKPQPSNIPKCPTCGSTDIKDISTLNRMVSVGAFGLASDKIGKTKECKNCGYKW